MAEDESLTDAWQMSYVKVVETPGSWVDLSWTKVAFTAVAALLGGVMLLWWRRSGRFRCAQSRHCPVVFSHFR